MLTKHIVRHNLKESETVKVALLKKENVRIEPDSVVVTIPVEPLVSKEQEVAITVANCPEGEHLVAFPATVKISYLVPLSVYNKNTSQSPVVFVDYRDVQNGKNKIPLHTAKSNVFQGVSLPVDSVEYIIE